MVRVQSIHRRGCLPNDIRVPHHCHSLVHPMSTEILVLTRDEVAASLTLDGFIEGVEDAFRAYAEGRTLAPALLHVGGIGGEFHVKAGGLSHEGRTFFGLKANGGFFGNPATTGMPAIQGVIYLADATNGAP